jgi:hypothetical protein
LIYITAHTGSKPVATPKPETRASITGGLMRSFYRDQLLENEQLNHRAGL